MNSNDNNQELATELSNAIKELAAQILQSKKLEEELIVVKNELFFQNEAKEKRHSELIVANRELFYQNSEKEKKAAELILANVELVFQNGEKEKRAAELVIANIELVFQNREKEKRGAELIIANIELDFQNQEKEKHAIELNTANFELTTLQRVNQALESFAYVASHDLQAPLRKIHVFSSLILEKDYDALSAVSKEYFKRIQEATKKMGLLINDILAFSKLTAGEGMFVKTHLHTLTHEIINEFSETIETKGAIVETNEMCEADIIPYQFRQLIHNLISNALKFSNPEVIPHIKIRSSTIKHSQPNNENLSVGVTYCHLSITDNGIGFEQQYSEKIFEVFQRLSQKAEHPGTGIGLAIVKKIVDNHMGIIKAVSEINKGTTFDIYTPIASY